MKKIKWPKVGDRVTVRWLDSGATYFRAGVPVEKVKLYEFEEEGKVGRIDDDTIVLIQSRNLPDLDPDSDTYTVLSKLTVLSVSIATPLRR